MYRAEELAAAIVKANGPNALSAGSTITIPRPLTHVPRDPKEEKLGWPEDRILKGVFVTVGTYPAKKHLPNGENAHICLKPTEWWVDQFKPLADRAAASDGAFQFLMLCE